MIEIIKKLKNLGFKISVIGGGTYNHINYQINPVKEIIEYIFTENGTIIHDRNKCIKSLSLKDELNDFQTNLLINKILKLLSNIELPFKRGTFIEYRNGLINIAPMGRNCTLEERCLFVEFNNKNNVLKQLKNDIENFIDINKMDLSVTFGGKISLDIFPKKWNKSMCMDFLMKENIEKDINTKYIFLGDKIYPGGNDYLLAIDERVYGHIKVSNESDCELKLEKIINFFGSNDENSNLNDFFKDLGFIYNKNKN